MLSTLYAVDATLLLPVVFSDILLAIVCRCSSEWRGGSQYMCLMGVGGGRCSYSGSDVHILQKLGSRVTYHLFRRHLHSSRLGVFATSASGGCTIPHRGDGAHNAVEECLQLSGILKI